MTVPSLKDLTSGNKAALAKALAAIERDSHSADAVALLNGAWAAPRAHVLGLTGPPGVGKSTLTNQLIARWRKAGKTVGIIAVDPSSKRSGGALLGDRIRLATDPEDEGVFIRSMAARDRLGGLAALTVSAMVLMRATFDFVLIETVGVGQSETEVAGVADTVIFCVQPGAGDSLQFMKAGIMETPHILAVTKADMGQTARQAEADAKGALSLTGPHPDGWDVPVVKVSAKSGEGLSDLLAALEDHSAWLADKDRLESNRRHQAQEWIADAIRERFGRDGLQKLAGGLELAEGESPFEREALLARELGGA